MLLEFEEKREYKYALTNTQSILLLRDERSKSNLKRYYNSPFPFLSNLEYFSNSIGELNRDLAQFGIKTRLKSDDLPLPNKSGFLIYLIYTETINSHCNRYLLKQYKRLTTYREQNQIHSY